MKMIIMAASAAFVLSAAAGTGLGLKRTKAALAVADSIAHADSAAHDSTSGTEHDAGAAGHASTGETTPHVSDTTDAVSAPVVPPLRPVTDSHGDPRGVTANPSSTATPAAGAAFPPGATSPVEDSVGRLPKLFTAMSARDAAKVFEQMSDNDVVIIIRGMTDRRAGEILAALPPARSAVIARAMLSQRGGGTR